MGQGSDALRYARKASDILVKVDDEYGMPRKTHRIHRPMRSLAAYQATVSGRNHGLPW